MKVTQKEKTKAFQIKIYSIKMAYMSLQILAYNPFSGGRREKWLFSARNAGALAQYSYNVLCTSDYCNTIFRLPQAGAGY